MTTFAQAGRLRETGTVRRFARAVVLLMCLALVGQPAFAQLLAPCSHASASADPEDATADGAHHDHESMAERTPSSDAAHGNCDCGCPCAMRACGHTVAMPAEQAAERPPAQDDKPSLPGLADHGKIFVSVPHRPPIVT